MYKGGRTVSMMEVLLFIAFTAFAEASNMKQISLKCTLAMSAAAGAVNASLADRCTAATFTNLGVFGAEVLDIGANPVHDFSTTSDYGQSYSGLNFCNVTVTYTHPGRGDTINVFAALPLKDWNGRFQGRGGGGFIMGYNASILAPATAQGFAIASSDGGHTSTVQSAESWALNSPGNVNLNLLEDYAYTALSDLTLFGKQLTERFFEQAPTYSYWAGCSTGGRQGLMLAQRYPNLYDGILALAPAINMDQFVVAMYYVQHVMDRMRYYPFPCELEAFTQAAVNACDELDGLKDGVISLPGICEFDPETLVGNMFECEGEEKKFSKEGARVAKAFWVSVHSHMCHCLALTIDRMARSSPPVQTSGIGTGSTEAHPSSYRTSALGLGRQDAPTQALARVTASHPPWPMNTSDSSSKKIRPTLQ